MKPEVHEDAKKATVSPIALLTISTMANLPTDKDQCGNGSTSFLTQDNTPRDMMEQFYVPLKETTICFVCLSERFENVSKICVTLQMELISYANFKHYYHIITMDQNW